MSRIYALANQKGGVGKTTTAVSLAAFLAQMGQHVLVVDVDPQANATASLGVDKRKLDSSTYDAFLDQVSLVEIIKPTRWANLELAASSPQLAAPRSSWSRCAGERPSCAPHCVPYATATTMSLWIAPQPRTADRQRADRRPRRHCARAVRIPGA